MERQELERKVAVEEEGLKETYSIKSINILLLRKTSSTSFAERILKSFIISRACVQCTSHRWPREMFDVNFFFISYKIYVPLSAKLIENY